MFKIVALVFLSLIAVLSVNAQVEEVQQKQEEAFQLIFSDQVKALQLIDSLIVQKKNFSVPDQGRHYSLKGVYFGVQNELDSASYYFNKALKKITRKDEFYPKLVTNLAITYKKKGNYQEALNLLLQAHEVAIETNNIDALEKVYSEMSSCYRALNNYNLAVEYSLNSIETENQKEEPDPKSIAFEKQKTANLYSLLGNYSFAEKIYEEIINYFETSPYIDANISTYLNYANALIKLHKDEEALSYIIKSENLLKEFKNNELYAFLKLTEANYFASTGEKEKAKNCFEISLASFDQHQDNYLKTLNQYLYFLTQNNWLEEVIQLAVSHKDKELTKFGIVDLIEYNNYIGNAYESLSLHNESSQYYKATIELKDSLQKQENFQIAKDLQAKYQNKIIQQKNSLLQERVISERRKTLSVLGFSLAIGILLMSLIFRFRTRYKNKNKLAIVLEKKLKVEDELLLLKDALLEQQKKELLSKSLENISLEKKITKITTKITDLDSVTQEQLEALKNSISPTNELNKLKFEFDRLYPNFNSKIRQNFPDLSKNDILFLSFIKLNFTYKEIATILNITHQSVISKKYRICKKMELDSEVDLYKFIKTEG